jgi:hypothetical protein
MTRWGPSTLPRCFGHRRTVLAGPTDAFHDPDSRRLTRFTRVPPHLRRARPKRRRTSGRTQTGPRKPREIGRLAILARQGPRTPQAIPAAERTREWPVLQASRSPEGTPSENGGGGSRTRGLGAWRAGFGAVGWPDAPGDAPGRGSVGEVAICIVVHLRRGEFRHRHEGRAATAVRRRTGNDSSTMLANASSMASASLTRSSLAQTRLSGSSP